MKLYYYSQQRLLAEKVLNDIFDRDDYHNKEFIYDGPMPTYYDEDDKNENNLG